MIKGDQLKLFRQVVNALIRSDYGDNREKLIKNLEGFSKTMLVQAAGILQDCSYALDAVSFCHHENPVTKCQAFGSSTYRYCFDCGRASRMVDPDPNEFMGFGGSNEWEPWEYDSYICSSIKKRIEAGG